MDNKKTCAVHMSHPESIFIVKSRKGFQTRSALIEAAFDLIADDGIAQLTVASISEAVGLTRSSAYNHFADISAVLDGVSAFVLDRIGELSQTEPSPCGTETSLTEERVRFVLQLSTKQPRVAKVLSELYRHHEPSVEAIEQRLLADINADIANSQLVLAKRDGTHLSRIAVASVMAMLRARASFPTNRDGSGDLLRVLFAPLRIKNE